MFRFNNDKTSHLKTSFSSNKITMFKPTKAPNILMDTPCQCNQSNRKTLFQVTRSLLSHRCKSEKESIMVKRCTKIKINTKHSIITKINNFKRWSFLTQANTLFHRRMAPTCHARSSCSQASPSSRTSNRHNKFKLFLILNNINNIKIRI